MGKMGEVAYSTSHHLGDFWLSIPHPAGFDALGSYLSAFTRDIF
jgi:hypothetical protein